MYNSYFCFSESPFENNLDQRFLFLGEDHLEVLAALLYFAETRKGFAVVCGEVGTGKTMLLNSFLDRLPDSVQAIMIPTPYASSLDILIQIAKVLEVRNTDNESVLELTDKVKKALTSAKLRKKSFVLIIDEAHLLSDQALEDIRVLSNLETPDQKLLQILLVGTYDLSHKLDRPEMRDLRQRINVNRVLSPLSPEETLQYIDHRLKQVGSRIAAVFEAPCRSLIFKLTRGYPGLINQLCDTALLIGMTEGQRKVNGDALQKSHVTLLEEPKTGIAEEMALPVPPAPPPRNPGPTPVSSVGAPAPAPGLSHATEVPSPFQGGVDAAALTSEELPLLPSEIIKLSAESYDYGAITLGDFQDWAVVVHNHGERECTLLSLEGLPAQGFSLPDPPQLPQTIPPQGSQALSIRFAPDSQGEKATTLTMTVWSQDEQILEVPLRGAGINAIQTPAGVYRIQVANSLGMVFVHMVPGTFSMGSPEHEPGRKADETLHDVTLTEAFYLQTTPVTQGQWQTLMGSNPAFFSNCGDDCPVEQVSWLDCQEFINRLNAMGEATYRLPTEAEWEYAARAGGNTAFARGDITALFCDHDPTLDSSGWYCGNSDWQTHPVAQKAPNAWGLYDMHGNVYEWCQDWYGEYSPTPLTDPGGPVSGTRRVGRGGSWFSDAKACRSAYRLRMLPDSKARFLGFRVARVV